MGRCPLKNEVYSIVNVYLNVKESERALKVFEEIIACLSTANERNPEPIRPYNASLSCVVISSLLPYNYSVRLKMPPSVWKLEA